MIIAAFVYALLSANVKWIHGIPVFEKMFFRSIFGLVMVSVIMKREHISIKGNKYFSLVGRGVTGFCSTFVYYLALSHSSIAETVTLTNTYPFLLAVLCWVFLGEKIRSFHIPALILSFAGAVIILRPGFSEINVYYLIALGASVLMATTYTFLRKARETENSQVIVFWYSLICTLGCVPVMFFEAPVLPTAFQLGQLLMLGILSTIYQLVLSKAYKYAPATEVSIYSYTTIIFSALLGVLIWAEIPSVFTILGAALIIAGAYIIFRGQNSDKNKSDTALTEN